MEDQVELKGEEEQLTAALGLTVDQHRSAMYDPAMNLGYVTHTYLTVRTPLPVLKIGGVKTCVIDVGLFATERLSCSYLDVKSMVPGPTFIAMFRCRSGAIDALATSSH